VCRVPHIGYRKQLKNNQELVLRKYAEETVDNSVLHYRPLTGRLYVTETPLGSFTLV